MNLCKHSLCLALAVMALCRLGVPAQGPAPRRPNILFAIADDASWPHMSAYGCRFVKTPGFDRVAREGVLFNNAFTCNPKCSPCRACILTGRSTWQLEEACDHNGIFPAKFKVYPDLLEEAGYYVGFTGKGWGPGDWKKGGWRRNPAGTDFSELRNEPPTRGISRIDYAANFEAFLRGRPAGKPFCFWYGGHEPHRGYEEGSGRTDGKRLVDVTVPPYLPDDDVVRSDLLDYAREIEWFDTHLGRMLVALEKSGELDNTLVIVTADNGMSFPRAKGQIYEDGFHLPLAIRWGSPVKPGRVVEDFISFTEFAPTFLQAAGLAPLKEMTGRSFLDVLRSPRSGQVDASRDRVFVGKERHDLGRPGDVGYPVRAIRTREYLYVRNFKPERWPAADPETGYRNIDDSPSKADVLELKEAGQAKYYELAMGKRPLEELYDMRADPACMRNLAEEPGHARVKLQLWNELQQRLRAERDPRILGHGDVFDSYPYVGSRDHAWDTVMGKQPQR
jgi:arylsulfatase A-like enzyme